MCTRNRPAFLLQAIAAYQAQDYLFRELIIVDGSDAPSTILPPEIESIYVHAPRIPIGDARNVACECAGGEIVVHWDDDDYHAPDRLTYQVGRLQTTTARLVGSSRSVYYDRLTGEVWERNLARFTPMLDGGTLVYRRELWRQHPFTAGAVSGSEHGFVRAHRAVMLDLYGGPLYVVAGLHSGNRANKDFADGSWRRVPLADLPAYALAA